MPFRHMLGTESLRTRWREPDSNPRSLGREGMIPFRKGEPAKAERIETKSAFREEMKPESASGTFATTGLLVSAVLVGSFSQAGADRVVGAWDPPLTLGEEVALCSYLRKIRAYASRRNRAGPRLRIRD